MAQVVLFHSVLGPRPGVHAAAGRIREAGHTVHTPDMYQGGGTFDDYEPAMALQDEIGFRELIARASAAVADLPPDLVYAGFSAGGALAQVLAARRPGARAALFLHSALSLDSIGATAWPSTVPVQVHYAEKDPFREQEHIDKLAASVRESGAAFDFFEYPGTGHLFADPDLTAEYDAASADLMWTRVIALLDRVD